jgi:hypothetical protein
MSAVRASRNPVGSVVSPVVDGLDQRRAWEQVAHAADVVLSRR